MGLYNVHVRTTATINDIEWGHTMTSTYMVTTDACTTATSVGHACAVMSHEVKSSYCVINITRQRDPSTLDTRTKYIHYVLQDTHLDSP